MIIHFYKSLYCCLQQIMVMKLLMLFLCILPMSFANVPEKTTYTTKYDTIDVERILSNERLLRSYINCLLDKGPCTPDGLELKRNMPDALETNCSKCSETQREGSEIIIRYLIDNKPEYWEPLQEKYDPSGSYKAKYLESKNNEVKIQPIN